MVTTVFVIISAQLFFNAIQLKKTDVNRDKLLAYSLLILLVGFLVNTPLIFLFGRTESIYCFAGSLIFGLFSIMFRHFARRHAKIDIKNLQLEMERNKEDIKFYFLQKMKNDILLESFVKKYSLKEEDLDDYFEVLSLDWPLENLLSVLMNKKVLSTYFDAKDISKADVLEHIRKMKLHPHKMNISVDKLTATVL